MIAVVLVAVPVVVDHFHALVPAQKANHHEAVQLVRCIKKHRLAEVAARDAVLVEVLAAATAETNHFTVSEIYLRHFLPFRN